MLPGLTVALRKIMLAIAAAGLIAQPLTAAPARVAPLAKSTVTEISKELEKSEPPKPEPEPSPRMFLSADGQTAYLVGEIKGGAFLRFDTLIQNAPRVKTVSLASVGGLVLEARMIAVLVHKRKLNTYVEFSCASACTQIFAAGRERVLGKDAQLGFHQGSSLDSDGKTRIADGVTDRTMTPTAVFGVSANDTLRYAYQRAGFEPQFIDKVLKVSIKDMWLPTAQELREAKVITRQADHPEVALPPGTISLSTIAAKQAADPLWQAAATFAPEQHAKALNEVWLQVNSGDPLSLSVSRGRDIIIDAGTKLLARSSDTMLDRMLTHYASVGRSQRNRGYPTCKQSDDDQAPAPDPIDQQFDAAEDVLMVQVFNEPKLQSAMSAKEVDKVFGKDIAPLFVDRFSLGQLKSSEGSCRFGFAVFELIDTLPAKKRIKAFRAVLSLPD